MKIQYAEFPFFEEATAAVEDADVDISALLDDPDHPVVVRGRERIQQAIEDGRVDDAFVSDTQYFSERYRIEVLSYPVARILVSAVGSRPLITRYARGEAAKAISLLQQSDDLESDTDVHDVLDEFDISVTVTETASSQTTYAIDVGDYLRYLPDNPTDAWLLQARAVDQGRVPLTESEIYTLLEEAIVTRVSDDLPLDIPDSLRDGLQSDIASLQRLIQDFPLPRELDTVVPELFPPGIDDLYTAVRNGESLDETERFVLFTFLARAGLTAEEIVALYPSPPPTPIADQARRVVANGFPPPNYEALVDAGICDASRVDTGYHPLLVYQDRTAAADLDQYTDWRETLYQTESQE